MKNKKIGIVVADYDEYAPFLESAKVYNPQSYNYFNRLAVQFDIENTGVVCINCGIGKVNAARSTQILIDNMKVDYIFNIGVAGGVDERLTVGDIVIGERLVQHDFNLVAFGRERGEIPDIGKFIESDDYLVKIAEDVVFDDVNTFSGVIASGDIFCSDVEMSKKIGAKFNTLCVEMEGASIAQVCYLSHIPFLIIRSISDVVNGNNSITYEEFLLDSSKNVALFMMKILEKLI